MEARKIIIAAALAALTILSAGCKKHTFWTPTPGDTIRFRAESKESSGQTGTKTVYSGAYYTIDQTTYERIDWVDGDMITIGYVSYGGSDGLCADVDHYRLSDITSDGKSSFANTIEPTSGPYGIDGAGWGGNGLRWHNNTHHRFFATYPAVDTEDDDFIFKIAGSDLDVQVPYYYPETQVPVGTEEKAITFCGVDNVTATVYKPDMSYAYLFCNPYDYYYYRDMLDDKYSDRHDDNPAFITTNGTINLPFEPHFMAFEITVAAEEGKSFQLNSATISTREERYPIAGTYIFQRYLNDQGEERWDDIPKEGFTSNKAVINFTDLTLTDAKPVVFTFILNAWYSFTKLSLTFNITKSNGQTVNRSLRLTGNPYSSDGCFDAESSWINFNPTLKHRIKNLRIPEDANAVWFDGVSAGEFGLIDLDV